MSVSNHISQLPSQPDGTPWLTEFRVLYGATADLRKKLHKLWLAPEEFKKDFMSGDNVPDDDAERWEEIHDTLRAIAPHLPTYDPTCYRRISMYYSTGCRMVAILEKYGIDSPWK